MGYSHGRRWTDEDTKNAILRVVEYIGINTFPTRREIKNFYGNSSLTSHISKSGGTREWAEKLNLPIKQCESELGNDYELFAIKEIQSHVGLAVRQTKPRYPYDLLVDESIKVDVKVSYPFLNNSGSYANTFNLEKKDPTCDLFIFYCLDLDGEIFKTLIIPSCITSGKTQIGVGRDSKWDYYRDKWEYFIEYSVFVNNLRNEVDYGKTIRDYRDVS